MPIYRYKFDYASGELALLLLELDTSKMTEARMQEHLYFWSSGQDLINAANGSIQDAFMQLLASTIFYLRQEDKYLSDAELFDDREGWDVDLLVDENSGVKIIEYCQWEAETSLRDKVEVSKNE